MAAWVWLLLVPVGWKRVQRRRLAAARSTGHWPAVAGCVPRPHRLGRLGARSGDLILGVLATWLWAAWTQASPRRSGHRGLDADTLREAGLRFLARDVVDAMLADAPATGAVAPRSEAMLERELAAVRGRPRRACCSTRPARGRPRFRHGGHHRRRGIAGPPLQPEPAGGGAGEHVAGDQRGGPRTAPGGLEHALQQLFVTAGLLEVVARWRS